MLKLKKLFLKLLYKLIGVKAYQLGGYYETAGNPVRCIYCGGTVFAYRRRKYKRGKLIKFRCHCCYCGARIASYDKGQWSMEVWHD